MTTPDDLRRVEAWLAAERGVASAVADIRIGTGYDAHALADGVPLVLGGVELDHPRGLAGHSDGDVIAHALIDALLGAAGLGDIGGLFPSGEERYQGISSLDLLREAYAQVRAAGWRLVNADCVLVGEEPRDRAAPRGDAPPARGGDRRGRGERARDHDRPARVHRPRRGPRGPGGRAARAAVRFVPATEAPDRLVGIWPEFLLHDALSNRYWDSLYTEFPEYQFLLFEGDELIGEANCVPVAGQAGAVARRLSGRVRARRRARPAVRARDHGPARAAGTRASRA